MPADMPGGREAAVGGVARSRMRGARGSWPCTLSWSAGTTNAAPVIDRSSIGWGARPCARAAAEIAASPIANYTERDLVSFAQGSGFTDIHMELHIDVTPVASRSWETFLGMSPHPLAPSLGAILAERFTPEERKTFEAIARPMVCDPNGVATTRMAYLTARRPVA